MSLASQAYPNRRFHAHSHLGLSVSAATRAKVSMLPQLDYQPSMIPKIMLGERSHLISVALGGLGNQYYAEFLQGLA